MIPVGFPHERRGRRALPVEIAPLPDSAGQHLGKTEPALRRVQQDETSVGSDRPAREIGGHLLAADSWKIERLQAIFGHGGRGAFVASEEMRWERNFYPMAAT